ncbi:unnamed protein product [Eruca vesicaria subsp. sativa]|uniref:Uncharacterized protein n=1 Tax=Eruca vesicaria subsp. sativa TaxID=29727 RepID=A0ABC8LZ55_ERUVS|nr:unnamed protein product [Eruca vesicaria subsp. sativa]
MYAELVWTIHKGSARAESYFNRNCSASDDCYVQASYAPVFWDAEEEEDDRDKKKQRTKKHLSLKLLEYVSLPLRL